MDIQVMVATHKEYPMPNDTMYVPVQVGRNATMYDNYRRDNQGEEHIANKNKNYCELTALYWGWKNLTSEYIGLVHYRRHFKGKEGNKSLLSQVITKGEVEQLLQKVDIIVPKKRKYYIETIYNHYAHTFHKQDLDVTRKVIQQLAPEYLDSFDTVMKRKEAHLFNMMIMKKEIADSYCEWLFHILFAVEKELDISKYSDFEARVFGRISERLLDVWLDTHGYSYIEVPFMYMEKIDWYHKIVGFLMAKFFNKKYKKSF